MRDYHSWNHARVDWEAQQVVEPKQPTRLMRHKRRSYKVGYKLEVGREYLRWRRGTGETSKAPLRDCLEGS